MTFRSKLSFANIFFVLGCKGSTISIFSLITLRAFTILFIGWLWWIGRHRADALSFVQPGVAASGGPFLSSGYSCCSAGDGPSAGFLIHGNRLKKGRPRKRDRPQREEGEKWSKLDAQEEELVNAVTAVQEGRKRGRPAGPACETKDQKRGQAAWSNLRVATATAAEPRREYIR